MKTVPTSRIRKSQVSRWLDSQMGPSTRRPKLGGTRSRLSARNLREAAFRYEELAEQSKRIGRGLEVFAEHNQQVKEGNRSRKKLVRKVKALERVRKIEPRGTALQVLDLRRRDRVTDLKRLVGQKLPRGKVSASMGGSQAWVASKIPGTKFVSRGGGYYARRGRLYLLSLERAANGRKSHKEKHFPAEWAGMEMGLAFKEAERAIANGLNYRSDNGFRDVGRLVDTIISRHTWDALRNVEGEYCDPDIATGHETANQVIGSARSIILDLKSRDIIDTTLFQSAQRSLEEMEAWKNEKLKEKRQLIARMEEK